MWKLFCLGSCLLVSTASYGQPGPGPASLLWEVSGKGLTAPSYLFGTMHLLCPDDFELSDTLLNRFKATRQLVMELDTGNPELMASVQQHLFMQDDQQLSQLLPEADFNRLAAFFQDTLQLDIRLFNQVKPFVLTSIVMHHLLACQPKSYELALDSLAKQQSKTLTGLETPGEQMALFDTIPYANQARMIVRLADSLAQARTSFAELVALYRKEDLEALYQAAVRNEFEMEGVLLTRRNRRWIPRIVARMQEHPTFIAVGAAHLGGPDGLLTLLEQAGYAVRPVFSR